MTMFLPPRRYVVVLSNGTEVACFDPPVAPQAPTDPKSDTPCRALNGEPETWD